MNQTTKFLVSLVALSYAIPTAEAFSFQLPNFFANKPISSSQSKSKTLKKQLLSSISNTNNGKTATPQQQLKVLEIVQQLEACQPNLSLRDPDTLERVGGDWFLQYTSPSNVGDYTYQPQQASEGASNIETKQFNAQGTVSAAGISVDTSNTRVMQRIDCNQNRISNTIDLNANNGNVAFVEGSFRVSDRVPNRAVVAFDTAQVQLWNGTITIPLGWVFDLLAKVRGSPDNGWLETTYVDDTVRLGRGNKSTLFVLTRDSNAATP